jgi:hypothetical protein
MAADGVRRTAHGLGFMEFPWRRIRTRTRAYMLYEYSRTTGRMEGMCTGCNCNGSRSL